MTDLKRALKQIKRTGKKIVFIWDTLAKDGDIKNGILKLKEFVSDIDSLRFLDPGIGAAVQSAFHELPLELSLEDGSINRCAILGWMERFQPQLKKLVLSGQLPISSIREFRRQISIDVEMLGFGWIQMFYSRRKLLKDINRIYRLASVDRPKQPNPAIMTYHGTLVFYDKCLNILAHLDEIENAGVDCLSIAYLQISDIFPLLTDQRNGKEWMSSLLPFNPETQTEGFYKENQSDKLFGKLSNQYLVDKTDNRVGIIIDIQKDRYCIVRLEDTVILPQVFDIFTPERQQITIDIETLHDLKGNQYEGIIKPGIYRFAWQKPMVTGSVLTLEKPSW